MPNDRLESDQNASSYVIRMWRDKAADEREMKEWRGWIENVQSGRRVFFHDIAVINSFINEHLNSTSEPE